MSQLIPGTVIDQNFEIIGLVGEGGIGQVYKARQLGLDRVVALKVMFQTYTGDGDAMTRFIREGIVLSEVEHPNIPRFYKFGVWNGQPYIAMEFLDGVSLQTLLTEGNRSWCFLVRVLIEACYAVDHVHRLGFFHRDLKPNNILISSTDGAAKVVDFGLAGATGDRFSELTQSGALVGTVLYMSPEQCVGRKCDERSDIYSLGCVLYACLTGAPPYSAESPLAVIQQHACEQPKSLQKVFSNFPADFQSLVDSCLSKSPEKRPQTVKQMAVELENLLVKHSNLTLRKSRKNFAEAARTKILFKSFLFLGAAALVICLVHRGSHTTVDSTTTGREPKVTVKFSPWSVVRSTQSLQETNPAVALATLDEFLTNSDNVTLSPESTSLIHLQRCAILSSLNRSGEATEEAEASLKAFANCPPSRLGSAVYLKLAETEKDETKMSHYLTKARELAGAARAGVPDQRLLLFFGVSSQGIDQAIFKLCDSKQLYSSAQEMWLTDVRKNPLNGSSRGLYAKCLLATNRIMEANEFILASLAQVPNDVTLLDLWMDVLYKQGRSPAAKLIMQKLETILADEVNALRGITGPGRGRSTDDVLLTVLPESKARAAAIGSNFDVLVAGECRRGNLETAYRLAETVAPIAKSYLSKGMFETILRAAPVGSLLERNCSRHLAKVSS